MDAYDLFPHQAGFPPAVTNVAEVAVFEDLEGLSILNAPRLTSLGPLRERTGLKALAVSAGIWSKMTVDSLDPLRSLTGLQYLQLGLRVLDHSLEPLEALTGLRTLELSNTYPVEEFGRLYARLEHTACRWFAPTADLPAVRCKRCGELGLLVLTGKGTPTLCPRCDDQRIRKHVELFQRLVASAA